MVSFRSLPTTPLYPSFELKNFNMISVLISYSISEVHGDRNGQFYFI